MATKIQSESDKRLIVKGSINGKDAYLLIDTGASAGLLHSKVVKKYNLDVNKAHSVNMVGAGGEFKAYLCKTPLMLSGKPMYQFLIADISSVVESIRRQTGIEIAGLISLSQAKMIGMSIDTDDNYVTLEK